jgi:hypothetical protein
MSDATRETARETAREKAKNTPLENAKTLRGIYNDYKETDKIDNYRFPAWVLESNRWDGTDAEKSHKFEDTIVVYDNNDDLIKVKELVEQREPVNMEMIQNYNEKDLNTNFGWKNGAYKNSKKSELYPNIGIYCHARVTNGIETSKPGAKEKNVHVMNLIGYAFDSVAQPDYMYFLEKYNPGSDDVNLNQLTDLNKENLKLDLIQRYRKIWLKACYICMLKGLKNLWYYGVGSGFFSMLLPNEYNKNSGKFYQEIFAPAFGIDPTHFSKSPKKNTLIDSKDETIPINFCEKYGIKVLNLQNEVTQSSDKQIPNVLFNSESSPENTLYINAWDPWSIIGNGNEGDRSLDGYWGRNSNMSVLGWSMTNSKLLPDITGTRPATEKSKILSMREILADIQAAGGINGAGKAPVSSDPIVTGKVAQFFMTFLSDDKKNGGLNGYNQCKKIVNAVKCLMAKGYKHIGLTYSANQEQTIKIWNEYNYPDAKNFNDEEEKTILQTGISGSGQARTIGIHNKQEKNEEGKFVDIEPPVLITYIDDLTKTLYDENKNFRKAFRIIPFSTMKTGGGTTEVALGSPGDINECIKAATKFLQLEKSIILGWCNQEIETLTDLNKDSFNKDYTLDDAGKFPFAIGGGVGGKSKLPILFSTYLKEYFKFLTSNWSEEVQKIVTDCSPDPKSADSTASSTSSPSKIATSKPLDHVIKDLIAGIKNTEDNEATLSALKIQEPSGGLVYKYPPSDASPPSSATPTPPSSSSASPPPTPPPVTEDKNLNSAAPTIDVMITEFESAIDEDDKNFYLGACRSIKAAYDLDMSLAGTDNDKKIRAKLLLNLRKNSLLLKLPAHWDYKEMKMGVEVVPELTRKPIISKDIIPMELNDITKNDIIKKLVKDFEIFKDNDAGKDTIDNMVDANQTLNDIYTNRYTTLLNDISYLNFNQRPSTSTSNSLIFELLAYKSVNSLYPSTTSLSNLLEYFTSKQAIENIDEYLKTNISDIVDKINKKIIDTTDVNTKVDYSNFYKFLLETKRINILEYILSEHENASDFSGVIRPYYEEILRKEKLSINDMLKSVDYIFKSGYGDGNCFYNSAGMQIIDPKIDYKKYNSLDRFSEEWWKQQNEKQHNLRTKLAEFLSKIYNKVKGLKEFKESKLEFIQYLQKYGPNNFDNVSTIQTPIGSYYWGTDDELFYISLLYNCFVVILSPNSQQFQTIEYKTLLNIDSSDAENTFKIISDPTRNNYDANGLKSALNPNKKPVVFMVGGRGHWDYAIPLTLNQSGGSNNIPRPITYTNAANTTHAASKSKHNSSFKASSSKSKGKSHSRSHTQRVK